MLAEFEFEYYAITKRDPETKEDILAISAESYAALRRILPSLPENPVGPNTYFQRGPYVADVASIARLVPGGITIKRLIEGDREHIFQQLIRRTEDLLARVAEESFNEKVKVHVPGLGLLAINEVQLQENCCTDELQKLLDEGWRILACCPQPDQRRPDYILGRTPEAEVYANKRKY